MNLPFRIALRYLFARKSHNVINVISAVSAVGLAIGAAALVLILSVYNGFNSIVEKNLSDVDPDIVLRRSASEPFRPSEISAVTARMMNDGRIESISSLLSYQVFLGYGDKQDVAVLVGVDNVFLEESGLSRHIVSGEMKLYHGELPQTCVGAGLAYSLSLSPYFVQPLTVYYPDREKKVSVASPSSSLRSVEVYPSGIFSISEELDKRRVFVPIEVAQDLYGADEISALEIRLSPGTAAGEVISSYSALPEGFVLADRYAQHSDIYKMMKLEKFAVFLILILVVLIVAFNVTGSISMLRLEKADDIAMLRALGAGDALCRRIFVLEGWLLSALGIVAGIVAGVAIALVQQHFGIVKLPGNFLVDAYPVVVKWTDILVCILTLGAVGFIASVIPDEK